MKNLITIIFLLAFSGVYSQSNCSLSATPLNATITCGQSVQLNASGAGGSVLMGNDFNTGTVGAGWSASASAQFDNPCGPGLDGSTHLWMGATTAAPRNMTTIGYNIGCTGTICFDLKFASTFASPCEEPDLSTEGVDLAYSTDGGATWTSIFYFDPITGLYDNWANYCFTIPAGAISSNTMFTWSQTSSSGNDYDHWGIDNVYITLTGPCATAAPYYYSWVPATGLNNPSIANPVASPVTSTTYTLYFTNGIDDTCMATVPITVNGPVADAGTMLSTCLGQSVTLTGSGASNLPTSTTFSSTTTTSIVDNTTVTNTITVSGLPYSTISTGDITQVCITDINHTWDSDLDIYLLCPDGTSLELSTDNGGSGDNYINTCFTPAATTSITTGAAPMTGTFMPEGAGGFNSFNGCTSNGNWVLQVADDAGGDVGTINSWNITFNVPAVTTPSWSPTTDMTGGNTFTPVVTPTSVGATQYTLTVNGNPGCTATDTVTVFVNQLTGVSVSAIDNILCQNDTTTLNASGGITYSWAPAAGLSANNIANPLASPSSTTNYTVTVSDGSCAAIDSVLITVNPLPPTDAGTNVAFCLNDSVQLNATGADTYTWSPGVGLSATNIANPVADGASTTTYTVTGTITATGCVRTDSIVVTVNPLPTANAGIDTSLCAGSSISLNATGGGTYSWLPATNMSNSTIANPTINPAATTNYTLTVTNSFNCIDKDTIQVTVNPLPNVDAGANGFTCLGTPKQLTATGAINYSWTPAGSLSDPNIFNPLANPGVTTTYTVVGTDANGCTKTDVVTVGIYTVATVSMNASSSSVCPGNTTTLTATGTPINYTWTPAATLGSTNGPSVAATPTATTTYSVAFATPGNGCIGHDSITISVLPLPVADAGTDIDICPGVVANLNGSGGVSYSWSPTTDLNNPSIANPSATPSVATNYTVSVTDANGCSDTASVWVFPRPNPTPGAISSTLTGCVTSNGSLTMAVPSTGTAPFMYSLNGGSSQTSGVFTGLAAGNYTITVTDSFGCSDSDTSSVYPSNPPVLSGISAVNAICTSATGSVTVPLPANGTAPFMYSINGGTPQSNGLFGSLTAGFYTIGVVDANGCTDTDTITVPQTPSAMVLDTAFLTSTVCGESTGIINVQSPAGGTLPYTYSINNGSTFQASNLFNGLATGLYAVVVKDANGCTVSHTYYIGSNITVNAAFDPAPPSGVYPLPVSFTNNSTNATGYIWTFGNGDPSVTTNSPSTTYPSPGTYTVQLVAYHNVVACADTAWATILVIEPPTITIPNIITPNGDGRNDEFQVIGFNFKEIDVAIFDRWGKKVTSYTGDTSKTWKPDDSIHDGTYFYVIKATSLDDKVSELTGYLNVQR